MFVTFDDWTQGRRIGSFGTNAGAQQLAFQSWRNFKEAFTPELVERAILETSAALGRPVRRCSDPFGGSGTTALACQFLGVRASTIELNPFLADLIQAKVQSYRGSPLEEAFAHILMRAAAIEPSITDPFPSAPVTFVERADREKFLFWLPVARRLAALRTAISEIDDFSIRLFYRVMLGSIAVEVSNATISGKGRRYRRAWRNTPTEADAVDLAFEAACLRALYEVRRYEDRPILDYQLLRGDSRKLISSLPIHDVSIFSPPYPNSFDYTDVYNIELWALGYLRDSSDNKALRQATLRSHVQIMRSFEARRLSSPSLLQTMEKIESARGRLWNKHIPDMIVAYFDDMRSVLASLLRRLTAGGRVYMVLGDSCYAGVRVPVAEIVAEEARLLGYRVIASEPARSMRASPQQGGRHELTETLLALSKSPH